MKGTFGGKSFTVFDASGRQIFNLAGERFSMSHRIAVTDTTSGQNLCTLRRETFTVGAHYYAEVSENGARLFDLESKMALGTEKFIIKFPNAAADGQNVELDWRSGAFSKKGELYLNGMMVAGFERELWKIKGEYHVYVAPGMDKLLAVCVMACVHDRRMTNRNAGNGAMASTIGN